MNRQPTTLRQPHRRRVSGLALTGAALVLLGTVCGQLTGLDRSAWRAVFAPGPADLDQALSAIAGSLALVFSVWLLGAVLLSLLAALNSRPSGIGTATNHAAGLIAPKILRHGVAALLGIAIVASPTIAQAVPTQAEDGPAVLKTLSSQAVSRSAGLLSPAWAPLDASPRPTTSGPPAHLAHGRVDLSPGWAPERPARPARSSSSGRHLATATAPNRRPGVDVDDAVVVRRGDTLWSIAARHLGNGATDGEIAEEWPQWFTANRALIGNDPDRLRPGERLRPPGSAPSTRSQPGRPGPAR
jgi:hypothetical protein